MNEDEFRRAYARIEENVKASDELKRRTKQSIGLAEEPKGEGFRAPARGTAPSRRRRAASRRPGDGAAALCPAWRTALATCLAVVAGVGLLFGTGALERVGSTLSGNSFTLVADAGESPAAGTPTEIGLEMFYPSRTGAGYFYDESTDSVDRSTVTVSRYYAFDMTVAGRNVESVAYSIEGEGISYGSWKSGHGSEGDAAEETSQSFTIPFDGGEPVVREIVLNYALDEDEKAEFDRLYDAGDAEGMEALLATCDAERLAEATVTATATFTDGSSQTKSYGFEPAEGFEAMYRAYLSQLSNSGDGAAWESLAGEPSLFELVEKGR